MLLTPQYEGLLRKKHESAPGKWGSRGSKWLPEAVRATIWTDSHSVLDYGCGQGSLAPLLHRTCLFQDIQEYDPGIPEKARLPDPCDLVVCTDVIEHIEPFCLDDVLAHIGHLSLRGLFMVISLCETKETLPDGRNAHLIIESAQWWQEKLESSGQWVDFKWHPRKGKELLVFARSAKTNEWGIR